MKNKIDLCVKKKIPDEITLTVKDWSQLKKDVKEELRDLLAYRAARMGYAPIHKTETLKEYRQNKYALTEIEFSATFQRPVHIGLNGRAIYDKAIKE